MADPNTWEEELRAAAKKYGDGWKAVQARRDAWRECVERTVLPTLEQAAKVIGESSGEGGLEVKAKSFDDRANASDVELWFAPFPTGLVWKDREGKAVEGMERSAAMGYGQGDDGRIAHWRTGHSLDGDEPSKPRVIATFDDPRALDEATVKKHVLDFVREAWTTSFRGDAVPEDRPIGFTFPEPEG